MTNKQLNHWIAIQLGYHVRYALTEYLLYRPDGSAYREGIKIPRFASEAEALEYVPFTSDLNLAYPLAQLIVEQYNKRYHIELFRTFNSALAARAICEAYYNCVQSSQSV